MSHDATTGYLPSNRKGESTLSSSSTSSSSAASIVNLYAKNQIGTLYQQLQDGARAFDIRPKFLINGTVLFHHGVITIPVTLEQVLNDVNKWSMEHPEELILLFHFRPSFESGMSVQYDAAYTTLAQIYKTIGIPYRSCQDVYDLTVGEAMELAITSSGGHVLALDHQDQYLSSCVKMNYVPDEIVTCYPPSTSTTTTSTTTTNNNANVQRKKIPPPCIQPKITPTIDHLKKYSVASSNNEPTDDSNQLGPPASLDFYPFFAIQALWQVDTYSAASGIAHLSSLLDDNIKSGINAKIVDWIYEGSFQKISLLLVDNVQLNGNAILSVLRTQCGQGMMTALEDDDDHEEEESSSSASCGRQIRKPRLRQKPMSTMTFWMVCLCYIALGLWIYGMYRHYKKYYRHEEEISRIQTNLQQSLDEYHIFCHDTAACAGGGGDEVAIIGGGKTGELT